jgi:tRNA (guanine-N7-)-methyltransferase
MMESPAAEGVGILSRTTEYQARKEQRARVLANHLNDLIPAGAPVVWEVGCGHGHFLTAYAVAHTKRLCVGIDIARDRIARATRKRNRAALTHLHFVLADADEFLTALSSGVRFSAIFILFPDPWPKRRHHKNRLLRPAFLDALFQRAGEGTRLYFRTDYRPYFEEAAAMIRAHQQWEVVEELWPFEIETVFQARASAYFSFVARGKFPPT